MAGDMHNVEALVLQLARALGMRLIVHPSESGKRWVDECIKMFGNACGRESVRDVSDKQRAYDLLVCGKKVQCKYRSTNRGGIVKIRNSHRATGGWYMNGEVDFFAIAYGTMRFVVPYKSLTRRDGSFLNDMHVSRLFAYEDAWDIRDPSAQPQRGMLFQYEDQEATDGPHP